jgi:Cu2+-exporting ATPase
MRQNLGFALVYNGVALPLAAFGHLTPILAAAAMSGSSLAVTLNALRVRNAASASRAQSPRAAPSGAPPRVAWESAT